MWPEEGCSLNICCSHHMPLLTAMHPDSPILTQVFTEVSKAHTRGKHHSSRRTLVTAATGNVLHDSPHSSVRSSLPPSSCHGTTRLHSAARSPLHPGAFGRTVSFHFTHYPDLSYLLLCVRGKRTSILNYFFFQILKEYLHWTRSNGMRNHSTVR